MPWDYYVLFKFANQKRRKNWREKRWISSQSYSILNASSEPTRIYNFRQIIWRLLKFSHSFIKLQIKKNYIIITRSCIYKLPHELLNHFQFMILENKKNPRKSLKRFQMEESIIPATLNEDLNSWVRKLPTN